MTRAERARENFLKGYNCAQAVLLAFAPDCGLAEETALLLSSSFGGGMGRLREVCGAVSGALMAAGMLYGYTDPAAKEDKAAHYQRVQRLALAFKDENGSYLCRELLGLPEGPDAPAPEARSAGYYHRRPCAQLVYSAARLLEEEGPFPPA